MVLCDINIWQRLRIQRLEKNQVLDEDNQLIQG